MMVNTSDVKDGKGGVLSGGFEECADIHPADEANCALPGGADPREIAEALEGMVKRREADAEAGIHRDM